MTGVDAGRRSLRRTARRGVTLVELLVVLVVAGAVAGVVLRGVRAQERSLRGSVARTEMRSQLRQAAHLLASELRMIAPGGGDVHEWSSSRLVIRSVTGASLLCRRTSDSTLVLPPLELERSNALSDWLVHPQEGDSLLVLDEGLHIDASDDAWRAYEIAGVTQTTTHACTSSLGFTLPGDEVRPSFAVRLGAGARLSSTIAIGAPIRIFHRVRYELYRAGDSRWYLGASDCRGRTLPPCSTIQPVSGPYRSARSLGPGSGIELTYFDAAGAALDPASDDARRIARVDVVVRAEVPGSAGAGGAFAGRVSDSLEVTVAVRNRSAP